MEVLNRMINTLDTAIETIVAREILDSRGRPTVEAEVHLINGVMEIRFPVVLLELLRLTNYEIMIKAATGARSTQGGTQRAGDNCSKLSQMHLTRNS